MVSKSEDDVRYLNRSQGMEGERKLHESDHRQQQREDHAENPGEHSLFRQRENGHYEDHRWPRKSRMPMCGAKYVGVRSRASRQE